MTTITVGESYDASPYPAHAYWRTHPDQLCVMATLFGMTPAPVDRCRVLELGCAVGGNLLPMAAASPTSQFVGIDLSPVQIEHANAAATALGLDNLTFITGDLSQLSTLEGLDEAPFDYIIAHGVYSWVATDVRDAMMDGIRARLAPQGVAYISYNTLPGWHDLATLRDLMRFHTEQFSDAEVQTDQALAIAEWLAARANATMGDARAAVLERELASLRDRPRAGIPHEFLSETNTALLFRDFVRHAETHAMRYLSDASPWAMRLENFDADLQALLAPVTGLVRQMQYVDFVAHRRFRRTLLCHAEVPLERRVDSSVLSTMTLLPAFQASPELDDPTVELPLTVKNRLGASVPIRDPIVRLALSILFPNPRLAVPFDTLVEQVRGRLETTDLTAPDDLAKHLAPALLRLVFAEVIRPSTRVVAVATTVTAHPETGALQRWQAGQDSFASNLWHEHMPLDETARQSLLMLDGTKTREQLEAIFPAGLLERFVEAGFLIAQ
ncbi:MAG: methyltransferase-like protein/trans-aconitate methyltransferase [Myxococcota bacterium]|jgi:methyltransferase-like protein/trans-aconitate methyltransferase